MAECACIALSVEKSISEVESVINFDPRPEVKEYVKTNSNWNGSHFRVQQSGMYHISWGFYRDGTDVSKDDLSLHLMKSPIPQIQDVVVATAFAGEDQENKNGRKSGHHVIITNLIVGEDLYLKAYIDGNGHSHLRDVYFTIFKICCDPSIVVGGAC